VDRGPGKRGCIMEKYHIKMPEDLFCEICSEKRGINPGTLKEIIILAIEIAREGREGRRIGTMFVVSDAEKVMKRSRSLILDPLYGHADVVKHVTDPDMRETVKELAQLDGAFIVSDEGVVISACRYLDAFSKGINLPLGLGSRHMAAASITKQTSSVAVVVSESSVVRVIDDGKIVSEIIPELWMFKRYTSLLNKEGKKLEQEIIVSTVAD
jgi:diadenylate cyclase